MSESVLDFAGLDAVANASATVEVEPNAVENNSDNSTVIESGETKDGAIVTADGNSEAAGGDGTTVDDLPGTEKTPQEIRQILKAIKTANPNDTKVVNQLHNAFERANAYSQVYDSVQAAEEAKAFIDSIGGIEGYEQTQAILQDVQAADELLYNGDASLIDNIVEDLKAEGKLDALGKLAPAYLDKLEQVDKEAFYNTMNPHVVGYLEKANFLPAVNAILSLLGTDEKDDAGNLKNPANIAEIRAVAQSMQKWFTNEKNMAAKAKTADGLNPEAEKLNAERTKFQEERTKFEQGKVKEFQEGVAKENSTVANKLLGKELAPYLKNPFFKAFKVANLKPLANTIQTNLMSELENDKGYKAQMKAMWGAKTPDKAKIQEFHRIKVESIANRIVRDTVQSMYPNYKAGGSAAGRIAASNQKKEQAATVQKQSEATGKPIYVAQKPNREEIDWSKDPKTYLFIAGKAYLKNGRFVTWRK